MHERAVEIRALAGHSLAGMPLLDMLRCAWPEAPEHQTARNTVGDMLRTHPEQAPPGMWALMNKKGDGPYAGNWFHRADKPDMQWCAEDAGYGRLAWNDEAQLRGILAQSPRQPWASRMLVRLLLTQNRHDQAKPLIDGLGRIDYSVVWWATSTLTGDQRLPYLQMLARLDAGAFIELGDQLVAAKREVEAADAYEQAFREAPDRVEVANSMGWWVDWLLKRGQTDRAREVADHGREVFSHTGLCIWSSFCERTGDLTGAEKALHDIEERYDTRNDLRAFWQRTRTIRVASAQAIEREEQRVFPAGRISANLNDFTDPPPKDIVLDVVGDTLSKAGVIKGQAVVAVDGTRCATCTQLDFLLSVHQDGPLRLIVWDGKAYAERVAGK